MNPLPFRTLKTVSPPPPPPPPPTPARDTFGGVHTKAVSIPRSNTVGDLPVQACICIQSSNTGDVGVLRNILQYLLNTC